MRGTVEREGDSMSRFRITPAHAGNRLPMSPQDTCSGDHPRACGEQELLSPEQAKLVGSPPRMRGTVKMGTSLAGGVRITPAHAGNSDYIRPDLGDIEDHPRACGEQKEYTATAIADIGSPPRMRGTVEHIA